jgi:hypothetical protein
MALDYRSELRRPVTLVLLALAVLGWFVAAVAPSDNRRAGRDIAKKYDN